MKPITKAMVAERDSYNSKYLEKSGFQDVDLEKGGTEVHHKATAAARAAVLDKLERRGIWERLKQSAHDLMNVGKKPPSCPVPNPDPDKTSNDRFFRVHEVESFDPYRLPTVLPQAHLSPRNSDHNPPSPAYSASIYSRFTPILAQRASKSYAAVTSRKSLRSRQNSFEQPGRYSAYTRDVLGPRGKEYEIEQAEAGLYSRAYKDAERILLRGSVSEAKMHEALATINKADQKVNMARHLSRHVDLASSTQFDDVDVGHLNSGHNRYLRPHWR